MAKEFSPISINDTKDLRKELGLPLTKELRYMRHEECGWVQHRVDDYEIVDTYTPSKSHSLVVTIENSEKVRILADYFVDMQNNSFVEDVERLS